MDADSYKQAVLEMYTAIQEVFAANAKLQRCAQIVWDWDRQPPSPIAEAPSLLLPPSPPSEPEEEAEAEDQPCDCQPTAWKSCPHECSVCLKALTLKDAEGLCWMCEEDLVTVAKDYPEDAAEAKQNNVYSEGAYHALVLRIRANNLREEADDTAEAEEVRVCLQNAERLDEIASHLLYTKADYTFKPWWFERWDYWRHYWRQPGSAYNGDKTWARRRSPDGKTVSAPAPKPAPTLLKAPCGIPGHTTPAGTLYCLTCCPSEQVADDLEAAKPKRLDYNNSNWPSPRPKLFAKACAPERKFKTHQHALEFLAQRVGLTVEDLLKMSPDVYIQRHMWNKAPNYWQGTRHRSYY